MTPRATACIGQPLRKTGTPRGLDHPQTAGRVEVEILRREQAPGNSPERTLGPGCPDGSIYLLSVWTRREIRRVSGPGGLNGIGGRMLHEQLSELGLIAGHDPGHHTRKIRQAGRAHSVLHLRPDALEG
jgi:hypothetical protein